MKERAEAARNDILAVTNCAPANLRILNADCSLEVSPLARLDSPPPLLIQTPQRHAAHVKRTRKQVRVRPSTR